MVFFKMKTNGVLPFVLFKMEWNQSNSASHSWWYDTNTATRNGATSLANYIDRPETTILAEIWSTILRRFQADNTCLQSFSVDMGILLLYITVSVGGDVEGPIVHPLHFPTNLDFF